MSGKVWRFSCCQKKERKDRGQHLSKTKQKGKEMNALSLQQRTDHIDIAQVNDFQSGGQCELPERTIKGFLSSTAVEQKQKTSIEDQRDYAHDQNVSIGVALSGFEQTHYVDKVGGPERDRDYQLTKKQLDVAQKDKHELEAQVLQANQEIRDLRHEIAVLQKRLQVVNQLPNLPPLRPPTPPPLPPPAQPHVNPLRALLTVIQKGRSAKDPNICPLQDVGPLPDGPEDADVTYNHQCPGMKEVLEMVRSGVSLRHVIQVHKVGFRAGEDSSAPGGSRMVPELQKILNKRKVSADKHVSDGSCDGSMEEDPAAHGPSPPRDGPSLQTSPPQEDFTQASRSPGCEVDEGQSDGDAASNTSTLPLTCPLDQGQVDSVDASPSPDGPASCGQPQMTGHADQWTGSADLRTSSEEQARTADPNPQSNCSPDLTDESPEVRYLNWDKWSGVDLKAALPFKSIFKSVSFMTDSSGGEKVALQTQQDHGNASLEAVEADLSCQSFGNGDFGVGTPDVPDDTQGQFSLLHDMLKPPVASCEEQAHAGTASEVAHVLNPEFLERSVDEPQTAHFLKTDPISSLALVPPERDSDPDHLTVHLDIPLGMN